MWHTLLSKQVGDVGRVIVDAYGTLSIRNERERYRRELVQVAAVAIAAIQALDRRFPDD